MKAAAGRPRPFPWADAMAVGLGLLRLSPADFWSMTPREFERAWSVLRPQSGSAPSRGELEALMNLFPDKEAQWKTKR
ncbi:MAG: phage tail assembly chaperone [Rhizobiaceae bacterium]|nr:phage tail assembly chaperone [Rhizobiaceae bacterium]